MGSEMRSGKGGHFVLIGRSLRSHDDGDGRVTLLPPADDSPDADKAAGLDHDQLHHYWTRGEGLAKWADHPHPWTALYHHLLKYLPDGEAKRTAANWFHDVKGYWPGDQKGKNPVGPG